MSKRMLLAAAVLCCISTRSFAEVSAAGVFGDHMVLQRDMPIAVWGQAEPGEQVTVRFGDQQATAQTDAAGKWKVALSAMAATSQGGTMTIQGKNTLTFNDVLVGEVWVCSGQSNMQYGWGKKSHAMFNWGGDAELAGLAEAASGKPIRSFDVRPNVAFQPVQTVNGAWSTGVSGSAVAFGFSYELYEALHVPVGVIVTCWGSSSIEGWMPLDLTEQLPHFKAMMEQFNASEPAKQRVQAAIDQGVQHGNVFVRKQPNLLYNAMLHPLIPYTCRGLVWYQGEANADHPDEYAKSLPLWIERLRTEWGRADMEFLIVMLPGYGQEDGRPEAKSWARFRDVQIHSLAVPHTAVCNTIDLGDAKNIHPADKAPVCRRLALLARHDLYGQDVIARGPMYKRFTVEDNRMTIHFEHAEGLATTDGRAPTAFWLAGENKTWYPAQATIDGQSVVLQSPDVAKPVACRYAFCGKPGVNLVNEAKLPAYPFRTDDWAE